MPHAIFPYSLPLNSALLFFGRQSTKPPADKILDRRDPSWNNFERPHSIASLLGGLRGPAVDIALTISLPMPDIDVVIKLSHTEERRSITERQSDRHAIAKGSRRQTVILG